MTPEMIERFLLGELPEEERLRAEECCLGDDALFDRVLVAEQELLDAHAEGRMALSLRGRFERSYLASPRGVTTLNLVGALREGRCGAPGTAGRRHGARVRPRIPDRQAFWWASAAAAVLAASTAWLTIDRGQASDLRAELAQARAQVSQQERVVAVQPGPDALLAVRLEPGLLRGGRSAGRLTVPAGVRVVWIDLLLPGVERYPAYRVAIKDLDGGEIASFASLRETPSEGGRSVGFALPRAALRFPSAYLVRVAGETASGEATELASYAMETGREPASGERAPEGPDKRPEGPGPSK